MDKPISMSVKDYLIRKMAVKLMLPEKSIEAVVNTQFTEMVEAMKRNDTVEISGFGKLFFNKKKAMKKMDKFLSQKELFTRKMNDSSLSETRVNTYKKKLDTLLMNIEFLKPKL